MLQNKNFVFTVFGASGSLAKLKIYPAIYKLIKMGQKNTRYMIMGYARSKKSHEEFRRNFKESIRENVEKRHIDEKLLEEISQHIFYCQGKYDDVEGFTNMKKYIEEYEKKHFQKDSKSIRCFYLAIPPVVFEDVVKNISVSKLKYFGEKDEGKRDARLIIEKPFGHNLKSAKKLEVMLAKHFEESETYRIDHYLGKETVQNLLIFRFANKFIEPLFNSRYISNVQITSAESIGVEERAGYFDEAGITRDMIQPHVIQLLSLIAMCRPGSLTSKAIKDEKVKVLQNVRPIVLNNDSINVVRAQYTAGVVDGKKVRAYREEEGIKPNSNTESFTALKLFIDNERWFGVPFFLRAGKRMAKKSTIIHIQFKNLPALTTSTKCTPIPSNLLTIKIQPEESISIRMLTKVSGHSFDIRPSEMNFFHSCDDCLDAYTRLILDALLGDNTLFIRFDEINSAWDIADPVIKSFEKENLPRLDYYMAGSHGPERADLMIKQHGYDWIPY